MFYNLFFFFGGGVDTGPANTSMFSIVGVIYFKKVLLATSAPFFNTWFLMALRSSGTGASALGHWGIGGKGALLKKQKNPILYYYF